MTKSEELIQINDMRGRSKVLLARRLGSSLRFMRRVPKISAVMSQARLPQLLSRLQDIHGDGSKAVARYFGSMRDQPVFAMMPRRAFQVCQPQYARRGCQHHVPRNCHKTHLPSISSFHHDTLRGSASRVIARFRKIANKDEKGGLVRVGHSSCRKVALSMACVDYGISLV